MPQIYSGNPANVSFGYSPKTITTASNTTPVTVTTSTAHGFRTSDTVDVAGNSVAVLNTRWNITVTGANTFTLNGSSAAGAGTGGTATDVALNPAITLPVGGDTWTAASIDVALEALADRTQALNNLATRPKTAVFTASTSTWVVPPGVTQMVAFGYGGGGGGGGGASPHSTVANAYPGGAGGAGAHASSIPLSAAAFSPGDTLTIIAGAAGSAGAGAAGGSGMEDGSDGGSGGSSGIVNGAVTLAVFYGGAGGKGAKVSDGIYATGTSVAFIAGASGPARSPRRDPTPVVVAAGVIPMGLPSDSSSGGSSTVSADFGVTATSFQGAANDSFGLGGGGGNQGGNDASYIGGGAGAGGGGGPGGAGGHGGNGGDGDAASPTAGANGTFGVGGAGGGGGGTAGSGGSGGPAAGHGGAGGAGGVLLMYWQAGS